MKEIVKEALELLESGQDFALVRLVAERGSTPRAAGAEMLVRRDGSIAGTIGGGLLEAAMMREAGAVLASRRSKVVDMRLRGTDVDNAEEMLCGGSADVLVAYIDAGAPDLTAVCRALLGVAAEQRRAWLFTFLPAEEGGPVDHCLLCDDDSVVGKPLCEAPALRTAIGKIAVHGSTRVADRDVLVEAFDPPATVVICGAGHVGQALAPVAARAGWRVVVLDDREEFANPQRFPGVGQLVVLSSFEEALSRIEVGEHSYVVIVTRGHTHDMTVLEQALRTPARYVGLMASKSKRKRIYDALLAAGFTEADIARVHSPIGLEIDAETPAELAISIVAEMIRVRAGKAR